MTDRNESIHWVKDKNGKNHVCYLSNGKDGDKWYESLTEEEKNNCYSEKLPWS